MHPTSTAVRRKTNYRINLIVVGSAHPTVAAIASSKRGSSLSETA
ncbi:hypothetical protein [Nodosilinea sp. LEGE 07298]|nr:hypothetical protein [Nodosilinea sp. LEGE 07298]